ncbi:MAG: serine/threonine protein kinase [Planctomycetaceae bacterium]|nr:serine/threonine protein kinase [Planctomycetaceae bacterium]
MVEPPSQELQKILFGLRLCTPADLRRCRSRVRSISRDLPAFDSVWIDALVQAGRLTPFQAQLLESSHARRRRLSVGPCVLIDRIGGPAGEPDRGTFLARHRSTRERCVVKQFSPPAHQAEGCLERLRQLNTRLQQAGSQSAVGPHSSLVHEGRTITVSRYVPGLTLRDLLIRRGRFPARVVVDLAAQLIDSLAALEQAGIVHGDLCLQNIRLTDRGQAVLVDTGLAPCVQPEFTIHSGLSPDRCTGIAPERIGTGAPATAASDIYSLGCLLWHLLAGRPPFPTADALSRLASHQVRDLEDVRQRAPDTPDSLAEAIAVLTRRDPARRPSSWRELKQRWQPSGMRCRSRMASFRNEFRTSVSRGVAAGSSPGGSYRMWVLALLFAVSGMVVGREPAAQNWVLSIASQLQKNEWISAALPGQGGAAPQPPDEPAADAAAEQTASRGSGAGNASPTTAGAGTAQIPTQLPQPDATGVIVLDSAGPWSWDRIDSGEPLVIRGAAGVRPVILVGQGPCKVICQHLTLENVHFEGAQVSPTDGRILRAPAASSPVDLQRSLLLVQSDGLTVSGCSFRLPAEPPVADSGQTAVLPVAIGWTSATNSMAASGKLLLQDTVFSGPSVPVFCAAPPQEISLTHCLSLAGGPLVQLTRLATTGAEAAIRLEHCTVRNAPALVALPGGTADTAAAGSVLLVEPLSSVLELSAPAALFLYHGPRPNAAQAAAVRLSGEGTVVGGGTLTAAWQTGPQARPVPLPDLPVPVEGLLTAPFEFAGPADSSDPRHSAVRLKGTLSGPRRSSGPPGADAGRLASPAPVITTAGEREQTATLRPVAGR